MTQESISPFPCFITRPWLISNTTPLIVPSVSVSSKPKTSSGSYPNAATHSTWTALTRGSLQTQHVLSAEITSSSVSLLRLPLLLFCTNLMVRVPKTIDLSQRMMKELFSIKFPVKLSGSNDIGMRKDNIFLKTVDTNTHSCSRKNHVLVCS